MESPRAAASEKALNMACSLSHNLSQKMSDIHFNMQLRPPQETRRRVVSYIPGAGEKKDDQGAGSGVPPRLEFNADRVQEYVCAPTFDRNCQLVENGVSWTGGTAKYLLKPNTAKNPLIRESGRLPLQVRVTDVIDEKTLRLDGGAQQRQRPGSARTTPKNRPASAEPASRSGGAASRNGAGGDRGGMGMSGGRPPLFAGGGSSLYGAAGSSQSGGSPHHASMSRITEEHSWRGGGGGGAMGTNGWPSAQPQGASPSSYPQGLPTNTGPRPHNADGGRSLPPHHHGGAPKGPSSRRPASASGAPTAGGGGGGASEGPRQNYVPPLHGSGGAGLGGAGMHGGGRPPAGPPGCLGSVSSSARGFRPSSARSASERIEEQERRSDPDAVLVASQAAHPSSRGGGLASSVVRMVGAPKAGYVSSLASVSGQRWNRRYTPGSRVHEIRQHGAGAVRIHAMR